MVTVASGRLSTVFFTVLGHRTIRVWPLALLLAGCGSKGRGGSGETASADSAATRDSRTGPAVAFRLPRDGGRIRVYYLPSLEETPWGLSGRVSGARAAVGMDGAGRRLLYRDSTGTVESFDLIALREREAAPAHTLAALGADGTLLAVDSSGAVTESQSWGARPWSGTLGRGIAQLFAAPSGRLIALRHRGGDTVAFGTREAGLSVAAPAPAAVSRGASLDGDAVAFATDSGVAVIEEREATRPWFVKLSGKPRALAFTPSGHRIYVALTERRELAAIDRFARRERRAVALPAQATALRADPWGRVLLALSASDGATLVVGLGSERVLGSVTTPWADDLPAVSQDGVLLCREGTAIVARDAHSLDSLGAVPRATRDLWFVGRWAPTSGAPTIRRELRAADAPAPATAAPATAAPATAAPAERAAPAAASAAATTDPKRPAPPRGTLWVQLSSSTNETWARSLAGDLAAARQPVELVAPQPPDRNWRVLVGPYLTRDAADSAGRSLGRPYWIVDRTPRTGTQ